MILLCLFGISAFLIIFLLFETTRACLSQLKIYNGINMPKHSMMNIKAAINLTTIS